MELDIVLSSLEDGTLILGIGESVAALTPEQAYELAAALVEYSNLETN